MSDSSWSLAIVASESPAGAIRVDGRTTSLGTADLPELIAAAAGKTPPTEPAELILVHPKTMGVDEVGEWYADLNEMGVRAQRVRAIADTEVIAAARYGDGDAREVIVGDAASGEVYDRRGNSSHGSMPLSLAMSRMVADAGVMTTTAVLVGSEAEVNRQASSFMGTQVRPVGINTETLANGALDPGILGKALGGHVAKSGSASSPRAVRSQRTYRLLLAVVLVVILAGIPLGIWWIKGPDGSATINEAAEQVLGPGARPMPTPTAPPVAPPEAVPAGVDVPEAIGYYFDLFDPVPLAQAFESCNDGDARKYENLSFYCSGWGTELNAFAADNGLPELAHPDELVSVHFDTRGTRPIPGPYDHECFIDYEYLRDDIIDGAAVTISEPCDPDDERYAGPWPEDEDADITIHDVRRLYATDDGDYHPVLRIYGVKDLAAVEALLNHFGLIR